MTFHTGQTGSLHMDRVRKPHIGWLPRVHQPRSLMSGLDEVIHQLGFGFALSNPFGVASRAFFHRRNSGKGPVLAQSVTFTAFGDARLFRVRLVTKLDRLLPVHIEHAWKRHPPNYQRDGKPESEHETVPAHAHSSTIQPRLEKKCWNKHTRCCRDSNCATPRTGEPPSQPGACVSWISCVSRSCSSACHAAACDRRPARRASGPATPIPRTAILPRKDRQRALRDHCARGCSLSESSEDSESSSAIRLHGLSAPVLDNECRAR